MLIAGLRGAWIQMTTFLRRGFAIIIFIFWLYIVLTVRVGGSIGGDLWGVFKRDWSWMLSCELLSSQILGLIVLHISKSNSVVIIIKICVGRVGCQGALSGIRRWWGGGCGCGWGWLFFTERGGLDICCVGSVKERFLLVEELADEWDGATLKIRTKVLGFVENCRRVKFNHTNLINSNCSLCSGSSISSLCNIQRILLAWIR